MTIKGTVVVAADHYMGAIPVLAGLVRSRGFDVIEKGAVLLRRSVTDWAQASHEAALMVGRGEADWGIICCYTGTGACISSNKVRGVRAALCIDAFSARGARRWNDANVLNISIRLASETVMKEIVDAWFEDVTVDAAQQANIDYINSLS